MASNWQGQATVLMTGGLDSSACAHFLSKRGAEVRGLFINHGQAAVQRETIASAAMADFLSIPLDVRVISSDHSFGAGELIGRNAMLIFSALFFTCGRSDLLAFGVHAGTPYGTIVLMMRIKHEHDRSQGVPILYSMFSLRFNSLN